MLWVSLSNARQFPCLYSAGSEPCPDHVLGCRGSGVTKCSCSLSTRWNDNKGLERVSSGTLFSQTDQQQSALNSRTIQSQAAAAAAAVLKLDHRTPELRKIDLLLYVDPICSSALKEVS